MPKSLTDMTCTERFAWPELARCLAISMGWCEERLWL